MCRERLKYSWSRVGAFMPTGATLSDDNRVLTIKNVQLAHAGTYGCRVRHPYGQQAYGTLTVAIEGRSFNCSSTYYTV